MEKILMLADATVERAGGKALGLGRLIAAGLSVPPGFVILDPLGGDVPGLVGPFLERLGHAPKAVRSSALSEDGAAASYAGQYESVLGVRGPEAVLAAVARCAGSARNLRVRAYSGNMDPGASDAIAVIVQNMVNARCAGVLFTADPVRNRRDLVVVNAVAGLGESLVSGEAAAQGYTVHRNGTVIEEPGGERLVDDALLARLLEGALAAERAFGVPVDLEWAVDADGGLHWLQCRPITTLSESHLNAMDSPLPEGAHVLTRCNIGEMMPGPVTPLTWSVFARAIDIGLQEFYREVGAYRGPRVQGRYILLYYNHLFMDMTAIYDIARHVLMATKKDTDLSIMGRLHDGPEVKPLSPFHKRLFNLVRYMRYLNRGPRRLAELERMAREFSIDESEPVDALYRDLGRARDTVTDAWARHYCTSGQSGFYHSMLLRILSGGKEPGPEHHREAARLLQDIEGIEGADLVHSLDALAALIHAECAAAFLAAGDSSAARMLTEGAGGSADSFRAFLRDHGHRCVREAELHERDWNDDPAALADILQARVRAMDGAGVHGPGRSRDNGGDSRRGGWGRRLAMNYLLPRARESVARRERSKSICIKIQSVLKSGYRTLGAHLAAEGLLSDPDLVFFLTHEELGALVEGRDPRAGAPAESRRGLMPAFFALEFDDVYTGMPAPVGLRRAPRAAAGGGLRGVPVSAGSARGRARVINSLAEAATLERGDIMIVNCTDVGWTPYFNLIGGLVTEIGSALSHGAVVAREYGVPAVVNVRGARAAFRDGENVVVDGDLGTVTSCG